MDKMQDHERQLFCQNFATVMIQQCQSQYGMYDTVFKQRCKNDGALVYELCLKDPIEINKAIINRMLSSFPANSSTK